MKAASPLYDVSDEPLHSSGIELEINESDLSPLPPTWKVAPMGNFLTEAQYGISVKGGESGRCPILRMTNQVNGYISAKKLQYADITDRDLKRFCVSKGDLLFNRTNSLELVGRTSIFDLSGEFVFASYLIRLRTKANQLDPYFLNLYLNADATQKRLKSIATRGVSQSNISATRLKGFAIPIPPLAEQQKIAAILGTVQKAIEEQERLLNLTAELKKTLLHQLFTQGLRHEPQKETDIGPVPESWKVCEIGDVAKIQSGGTPARDTPENWNGGTIPWVKTGEIDYCIIRDTEEKITPVGLANSAARLFPAGTLLMAMYGQGITRGRVAILGIEATTNQACASITPSDEQKVSSRFLYHWFEYHYENLRKLGHGANQKNMNAALIRGFPLAYPAQEDQKQIVTSLTALDAKRDLHQRKHSTLTALFRTLLHQLMTAQIRVKIN